MAGGAGSEPGRATVSPEQLPVGKAIALHLFPGVALVSIMYLLQPAMAAIRAPRFLGFLFAGRRRGRLGARILVAEGPSQRRFPLAGCRPLPGARPQAPLPGGADAVWMAAARVGHLEYVLALQEGMFSWLPSWTRDPVPDDLSGFAPWTLVVTGILTLLFNGFLTIHRGVVFPRLSAASH